MARGDVYVVRHERGWAVTRPNAERASGVYDTQADAVARATQLADGGVVHIQNRHGKFRQETPWDE